MYIRIICNFFLALEENHIKQECNSTDFMYFFFTINIYLKKKKGKFSEDQSRTKKN